MNENHKFEQIWGFRRNTDSSSDDSKSNPDIRESQEKLMLVPNMVSTENDRVSETENQHVQVEKKKKRTRKATPKKDNKKNKKEVKSKPKKDSRASSSIKKVGKTSRKKKSKFISQMTIYDDFRIFTKSIVEDLQVARETMFAKMRKEMDQLLNSKPSSTSTKKKKSESSSTKKLNQKPRARKPTKPKQKNELAASKELDPSREQVKNDNTKDQSTKNSSLIDSSAVKPIFTNTPDQIVTSYMTVPLVLSNSRSNDTSLNLEKGNYSGISFGHNSTESSYVGNGYPIGLNHHQRFDNSSSFGIPNRVVQGLAHDGSLLGTRIMNGGGVRYTSGLSGHAFPNHFGSSSFRNLYPN